MDISIIYVNYESSQLLKASVESLRNLTVPHEIIVVDNNSSDKDKRILAGLHNITLIQLERNRGFAAGCNIGAAKAQGSHLFFLNPDTIVFEGAVEALLDFLHRNPTVGAVGPRVWWDTAKQLLLSSSETPGVSNAFIHMLKGNSILYASLLRKNLQRLLHYWRTDKPFPIEMLPGAAIMMKKQVFLDLGMFDETFPLYFEDADLIKRIRDAGYTIYMLPQSEIVHFYNQSAKKLGGEALRLFEKSKQIYAKKHYSRMTHVLMSLSNRFETSAQKKLSDYTEITSDVPPLFTGEARSQSGEGMFVFSMDQYFFPAAGTFVNNFTFAMPEEVWMGLQDGMYWAGMFRLSDLAPVKLWCIHKHGNKSPQGVSYEYV
jgi:GT2 family glycosyltransferase